MSETIYKPLTPSLRKEINNSIDGFIAELNTCSPNAFVNAQICIYETHRKLINRLPDGYPLPFRKE